MNRSDFLKALGLGAGGLLLPNPYVSAKPVKIYDNYVRGPNHYSFVKLKSKIKEGDEIQLVREPDNKYDSFAIQVNYLDERMGYIAAFENIVLANILDNGVVLKTFVSKIQLNNYQEEMAIKVYADLVLPGRKLITSMLGENRADDAADIYRNGPF